jgi:hypothetical protein
MRDSRTAASLATALLGSALRERPNQEPARSEIRETPDHGMGLMWGDGLKKARGYSESFITHRPSEYREQPL